MKTVKRKSEQWLMGYSWIDLTLVAKVQIEEPSMFFRVCLTVEPADFAVGYGLMESFRSFQGYLDTLNNLPKKRILSSFRTE